MFNTGARVQEIVTLCVRDLQLEALPQVRLYGKGRKERWCPLWPQTAEILRAWLREPGRDRKSTRLNSSHLGISYAVFCLKKKKRSEWRRTWKPARSLSRRGARARVACG